MPPTLLKCTAKMDLKPVLDVMLKTAATELKHTAFKKNVVLLQINRTLKNKHTIKKGTK